jgi:hypothetical protein
MPRRAEAAVTAAAAVDIVRAAAQAAAPAAIAQAVAGESTVVEAVAEARTALAEVETVGMPNFAAAITAATPVDM